MGLRVRKSFKIAPGVRVNVGKKSAGISFGTRGCRYSVNSRTGATATVGIPGTGISYSTKAYKKNSELKKRQSMANKLEEIERNKLEVEMFENKIDMIKSIHKECDEKIEWDLLIESLPPFELSSTQKGPREQEAINNLENYKPSFFSKMFKKQEDEINKLKDAIEVAREEDKQEYEAWENLVDTAKKIVNKDIDVYFDVIEEFRPLDDLLEFGSGFEFNIYEPEWLEVNFDINSETVVPSEIKTLTKTGKVSTKKMTKTMFFDIQQDYVCSCIIRIARDMFALLPIDYVIINALDDRLDTSTGIYNKETVVSVKIDKSTLYSLNLDLIDPSDSMNNFMCNMDFKKTKGLMPVEKITINNISDF